MDAWLIVLITLCSGIALFAAIFALKNRNQKRNALRYQNSVALANVQVVQSPQQYPQQVPPPYNIGFIQQNPPQVHYHPPIPSTSNQGIYNPQNPQAFLNMPQSMDGRSTVIRAGMINPM